VFLNSRWTQKGDSNDGTSVACLKSSILRGRTIGRSVHSKEAARGAHDVFHHLHWFTERFDTADLKDPKAMLDELAARTSCVRQ